MDSFSLGWVVGLIEGEGTICDTQKPMIRVRMTDEDVVRRLLELTGVGYIGGPYGPSAGQRKPQWAWTVGQLSHVLRLLREIEPHLGQRRRARALEVLDRWSERTVPMPGIAWGLVDGMSA